MGDVEMGPQLTDIQTDDDVAQLVHTFYDKIKRTNC